MPLLFKVRLPKKNKAVLLSVFLIGAFTVRDSIYQDILIEPTQPNPSPFNVVHNCQFDLECIVSSGVYLYSHILDCRSRAQQILLIHKPFWNRMDCMVSARVVYGDTLRQSAPDIPTYSKNLPLE